MGEASKKNQYLTKIFLVMLVFWIALSGFFIPFMLGLGVISALLVTYMVYKMDFHKLRDNTIEIDLIKVPVYILWLLKEIILSNLRVCFIIINPELKISPSISKIKTDLSNDAFITIFANSITLTPGTITIDAENKELTVHSLDISFKKAIEDNVVHNKVKSLENKEYSGT